MVLYLRKDQQGVKERKFCNILDCCILIFILSLRPIFSMSCFTQEIKLISPLPALNLCVPAIAYIFHLHNRIHFLVLPQKYWLCETPIIQNRSWIILTHTKHAFANSVDPDHAAYVGAAWSVSALLMKISKIKVQTTGNCIRFMC
jgi:hypothetical protein